MNFERINYNAKFTQHLVKQKVFEKSPLTVVDVGAREGFEAHWSLFDDQVNLIGFEPDSEECNRLNAQVHDSKKCFHPVALYRNKGTYPFYITNFPASSGLYPGDMNIVERFPDDVNLKIKAVAELETTDFDSFSDQANLNNVDFMKLDTEGAEFDILEGAINSIRKSVMGISCEALFAPWHKGQKLFSDIDILLRAAGFHLYDMSTYRHSRKSLPAKVQLGMVSNYGQLIWCQALYCRDAVHEINNGIMMECGWDQHKILKLCSIFEIFNLPDCAIELLQFSKKKGIIFFSESEVTYLSDLIVSGFMGYDITYADYLNKSILKNKGNSTNFQNLRKLAAKIPYASNVYNLMKKISLIR